MDDGSAKCEGREKYWSEAEDSEKIERMRGIVKQQANDIRRLSSIVDKLQAHGHSDVGVVIPLRGGGCYEPQGLPYRHGKQDEEVYF